MVTKLFLFCLLTLGSIHVKAQSLENAIRGRLDDYFINYQTNYANIGKCKLDRFEIDHEKKRLHIYANSTFGYQPFTKENTTTIYRQLKQLLPGPVNYYHITLYADGLPIENLIPNVYRKKKDESRLYKDIEYKGKAWIQNLSKPYKVSQGLQNRHLALWQSHGQYYKNTENEWKWQRPRLFCTTEDLFTQAFVIPYLIPMLENAGAIVFTPRERDKQTHEIIVDNNTCSPGSKYIEINYKKQYQWNTTPYSGFAQKYLLYPDNYNPFKDGTARFIPTLAKAEKAFVEWIPNIPTKGRYAVYVSYQSLSKSVTDAQYIVYHNGGVTKFNVNQQIGGGTWVYLGTFEFDKGTNEYGMVVLSNESKQKGVVCADAVRFGGGMGNILRGGRASGKPRYLEGARYWAQWAGMPYTVYSKSNGTNDYNDDINTRSLMTNYLSGGSVYNPIEKGLGVPFELCLGFHSDAGFKKDNTLVGSLGIYTTDFNNGKLNSGISRYTSRDLADMILTNAQKDISASLGINWVRRSLWNRNYSETRLPAIPSVIFESLSHQNFSDLAYGFRPDFQFTLSRSIYKSILKYLADMHNTRYTVQPLPVSHFAITEGKKKNTFDLRWSPVEDPLEPTATPQGYIVYTRIGYGGFDNGVYVNKPRISVSVEPGLIYSFKVTAVNKGGESFPSEILAAYKAKQAKGTVLIVNGFHRTSGPAIINNKNRQGFDLIADPGIPYIYSTSYCGYQQNFDRNRPGLETPNGLGYSGNELEGKQIAGNTFDYPFIHGKSIQRAGGYSFVSCSDETLENGSTLLSNYKIIDYICGAEKKIFSSSVQKCLYNYCMQGGKLFMSGSYIGSCLPTNTNFAKKILKCNFGGSINMTHSGAIYGTGIHFNIPRYANEQTYAVPSPECLLPENPAFSAFVYTDGGYSAGIAFKGKHSTFVLGFPFESITDAESRNHIMKSILNFFTE